MYAGRVVEAGPTARGAGAPAPPLHDGPRPTPSPISIGRRPAGADRGQPARSARSAAGLPLRAALPVRAAALRTRAEPPLIDARRRPCAPPAGAPARRAVARASPGRRRHGAADRGPRPDQAFPGAAQHAPRRCAAAGRWSAPWTASIFAIGAGESVGLLGESGCGKTTTGAAAAEAGEPTAGEHPVRRASASPRSTGRACAAFAGRRSSCSRIRSMRSIRASRSPRALAEPLHQRRHRARRASRRASRRRCARVRLPDAALSRRLLPASALRRPVAAHRAGARAGAGAGVPGRRRAGLDARRQRARRHPEPDARGARRAGARGALHLATTSRWCATSARARWSCISAASSRRDRPRSRPRAAASLHARAGAGRAGAQRRPVARAAADQRRRRRMRASRRRAAASATAAPCGRALRRGRSAAARGRARPAAPPATSADASSRRGKAMIARAAPSSTRSISRRPGSSSKLSPGNRAGGRRT